VKIGREVAVLVVVGLAFLPGAVRAAGDDPVAEVTAALQSLGPPGVLWGRFAIEEESPAGGWTPLSGVEVTLYPATPALVAELDRIRRSARTSGPQYESAVSRVQAALAVHQARVDGQSPRPAPAPEDSASPGDPPPAAPGSSPATPPTPTAKEPPGGQPPGTGSPAPTTGAPEAPAPRWRQRTDPAGIFAFDELPSGDWLVVALRVTAYGAEKLRAEPRPRSSTRGQKFAPRASTPPKEAEVWVVRARVGAGERVGLELSDRARWLVGPVR
jgi:hypothetical protein